MVYVRDYFLLDKSYQTPEDSTFKAVLDIIKDELGEDIKDHADFANNNLVVPIKKAASPRNKAKLESSR